MMCISLFLWASVLRRARSIRNSCRVGTLSPRKPIAFEYRSSDASGPVQARKEYRVGFFSLYDDLWNTVNLRNDLQHYQDGLFMVDVSTFSERPIRESVLNVVSHRDYQLGSTCSSANTAPHRDHEPGRTSVSNHLGEHSQPPVAARPAHCRRV